MPKLCQSIAQVALTWCPNITQYIYMACYHCLFCFLLLLRLLNLFLLLLFLFFKVAWYCPHMTSRCCLRPMWVKALINSGRAGSCLWDFFSKQHKKIFINSGRVGSCLWDTFSRQHIQLWKMKIVEVEECCPSSLCFFNFSMLDLLNALKNDRKLQVKQIFSTKSNKIQNVKLEKFHFKPCFASIKTQLYSVSFASCRNRFCMKTCSETWDRLQPYDEAPFSGFSVRVLSRKLFWRKIFVQLH